MKNQDKLFAALRFVVGSMFLCWGLIEFSLALTWRPLDNNFLGGVLGIPLAILLTVLFVIGWWFEWLFEKIIVNKGRKTVVVFLLGAIFIYLMIGIASFLILPLGFSSFALMAGTSITFGSFWFQLSRMRPEMLAKIRNHP